MPPFRVEYYCPRQAPYWQRFGTGLFSPQGKAFPSFDLAAAQANALIWQYHSARVIDVYGNVQYQV